MEKSQQIDFYCRNCKKSLKMSYTLSGDADMSVMFGITTVMDQDENFLPKRNLSQKTNFSKKAGTTVGLPY